MEPRVRGTDLKIDRKITGKKKKNGQKNQKKKSVGKKVSASFGSKNNC